MLKNWILLVVASLGIVSAIGCVNRIRSEDWRAVELARIKHDPATIYAKNDEIRAKTEQHVYKNASDTVLIASFKGKFPSAHTSNTQPFAKSNYGNGGNNTYYEEGYPVIIRGSYLIVNGKQYTPGSYAGRFGYPNAKHVRAMYGIW